MSIRLASIALVAAASIAIAVSSNAADPAVNNKPSNPGEARGFNPQPDPPIKKQATQQKEKKKVTPGEAKGFNPQPDPPLTQKAGNADNAKKLDPKQKALGGPDTAQGKSP